jgi:HSP20 family protein
MQRLADDMDNLFSQFGMGRMGLRPMLGRELTAMEPAWTPQVDVSQKEDRILVHADLPGVKKEDVHVDVEKDMLIIRGERRDEREEKEKGYYRSERSYGSFYRALPLPEGVDPNRCEATYKDGVLEINIPTPKREEQKGRRIEIH